MSTCYIYRCSAKKDMYIYLSEKDDFDCLPENLRKNLGVTEFAMKLELDANKKLAKEDPVKVINNLSAQGFHLQMPSDTSVEQLLEKIAQQTLQNQ
ncbi:MAG: YcgL domain-containing protein [Gammaproteobacteria bacterium]|nr:YcgL domain-containing protein [Gammaproteobacteria bacterium]